MISTRSLELVIDTVVSLTLAKWETVSGPFGGYLMLKLNGCFLLQRFGMTGLVLHSLQVFAQLGAIVVAEQPPFHFCATFAAFRMGDQRSISAFTNWPNCAGVRSLLGGIDPPSSASFAATPGSSRAVSSAAASLSTIGFGVPLGAKIPAQILI